MTLEQLQSKSFISIAAGVAIVDLEQKIDAPGVSFIRVMPNTPCCVGQCAAAYSPGFYATPPHKLACEAIFKSVGIISQVPEHLMDGVTGLSGSGPACKMLDCYVCSLTCHLSYFEASPISLDYFLVPRMYTIQMYFCSLKLSLMVQCVWAFPGTLLFNLLHRLSKEQRQCVWRLGCIRGCSKIRSVCSNQTVYSKVI